MDAADVSFGGTISTGFLTVTADGSTTLVDNISATNDVSFTGGVTLNNDISVTTTANDGSITFNDSVTGGNNFDLNLTTDGTGTVALDQVTLIGDGALDVFVLRGGR